MDKDEYFKILEDICCTDLSTYVLERDWATQSILTQTSKRELTDSVNKEINVKENDDFRMNKLEMNVMKYYE